MGGEGAAELCLPAACRRGNAPSSCLGSRPSTCAAAGAAEGDAAAPVKTAELLSPPSTPCKQKQAAHQAQGVKPKVAGQGAIEVGQGRLAGEEQLVL